PGRPSIPPAFRAALPPSQARNPKAAPAAFVLTGASGMTVSEFRNQLPDYAKDLKLNLDSVLSAGGSPGLDGKQIRAIALASAIAARHAPLVAAIEAFAAEELSPEEIGGARAAAAIMAMNNIYYRANHLIEN